MLIYITFKSFLSLPMKLLTVYLIPFQPNFPIPSTVVTPAFDLSREPPVYPNPIEENQPGAWEYKPPPGPHYYPPPYQQPPLNMSAPPPHMNIPPPNRPPPNRPPPIRPPPNRLPPMYPHSMDGSMLRGPPPHSVMQQPPPVINLVGSAPELHAGSGPQASNVVCVISY